MKINITKKQYKTLIKLLHLGTWMANAHRTDDRIEEFDELEQYILSFCKDFGMDDSVEYAEDLKMFFLTGEFLDESGVEELIDEYDNDTFWDELIYRMAERDLIEKYGKNTVRKMEFKERINKEQPFLDAYGTEFEENGLSNLRLIKGSKIIH
jgi:hypothetical protein